MRKILVMILAGSLMLAAIPGAALAGDTHAVSNRWAGVAIGAAAAVAGGILLGALQAPVAAPVVTYTPPPVVYSPPPLVYAPPPQVYYAPPVVYTPAPVVIHRDWGGRGHWERSHHRPGRAWHRD